MVCTRESYGGFTFSELGLKTAQFLIRSKQPLSDMVQIAQDFPRYAHSISQVELDHEPVEEILINQESMPAPGLNVMWLNGLEIDDDQVDPFSYVDMYALNCYKRGLNGAVLLDCCVLYDGSFEQLDFWSDKD